MALAIFISAIIVGIIFKRSKLCTVYILAIMYIFAAYRTYDADYNTYLIGYNSLSSTSTYRYAGYTFFLKIFSNIGLSFETYNSIFFLLVFTLLIIAIRLLTKNVNTVLALYLIYSYSLDVIQMKSCIANVFALLSISLVINLISNYVEGSRNRRIAWVISALCITVAIFMHFSTLYYAIVLILYLIIRNRKHIGAKMLVLSGLLLTLLYSGLLVIIMRYANVFGILSDLDYMGHWATRSTRYGFLLYVVIIGLMVLSTNFNHLEMTKNRRLQETRCFLTTAILVMPFVFLNGQFSRLLRAYMILIYIVFSAQKHSFKITWKRVLNNLMLIAAMSMLFYLDIGSNYEDVLGALLKYNSIFGVPH